MRPQELGYNLPRRLLSPNIEVPAIFNETRSSPTNGDANFDSNMVIILVALLCALMCALGINSIVRCALRCGRGMTFETAEGVAVHMASTGLTKDALHRIPVVVFKSGIKFPVTDCPICLGEFTEGQKVRILPGCNHGFHVKCIDAWLASNSSCPNCRQLLFGHLNTTPTST